MDTESNSICGVYLIKNPSNKVYVGKSICIESRWNKYKKMRCKSQPALYNSLKKYGWENHKFEILETCLEEELSCRERYWQDFYDVMNKNGLNCRLSSCEDKSGSLSEETKLKMSINNAKYWSGKTGEDNPNFGKSRSVETIEKLSMLAKERFKGEGNPMYGKNHSEVTKKLFSSQRKGKNTNCNNPNATEIIDIITLEVWCSMKEASKCNSINYGTLKKYLSGKLPNKTNLRYLNQK